MNEQYFIKCNHCNYLNPFKTEFVTFCDNCGKKLHDNFQDWNKNHPGKSLNDFRNEVCVTTNTDKPVSQKKRINAYQVLKIFLISVFIITASGIYFSRINLRDLLLPSVTPASLLNSDWHRNMYGKYGLSVLSPEKLEATAVEFPNEYKTYIENAESYTYHPSKRLKAILVSVFYKEKVRVSLEGAVAGFANGLMNSEGISNVEFRQSNVMFKEVNGMFVEGTYIDNGEFMHFQCVMYVRNSNMWQVLVNFADADKNARAVAEKIIDSVEINYQVKSI